MQKRGRAGKDQVETAPLKVIEGNFGRGRPEPIPGMTARQQEIWQEIVRDEPVDFFSTAATKRLLQEYCEHRASAEDLTRTINEFDRDWLKSADGLDRYQRLCKARDRESRAAGDKATRLRLTNQARYTTMAAGTASRNTLKAKKPWDL